MVKPIIENVFLKTPERKRFGWSEYTEKRSHYYIINGRTFFQKAIVRGKKLCLFGKFIWDYEMGLTDYTQNF